MKQFETPDKIFGELFRDLHMSGHWSDGKVISDALPLISAEEILKAYHAEKSKEHFNLKSFFNKHFKTYKPGATAFKTDKKKSPEEHIRALWNVLVRSPDEVLADGSLISLPRAYVVPGGRFNEIYYWDSFFTMLGLRHQGGAVIIESMINNFSWMIDRFGFIPNGNRTYFLSRSQPPFYAMMVELLTKIKGKKILSEYLPFLFKEYAFWMNGADKLSEDYEAFEHSVKLPEGILNRYYDRSHEPRAEMYRDDIETLEKSNREPAQLFLDIRAACESGWDFSSRWFADQETLATIETTSILPVDLNCLLYKLELMIAEAYRVNDDVENVERFQQKAEQRKSLIQKYFWDEEEGYYFDFHFKNKKRTASTTLAGIFPLFFEIATETQAGLSADTIRSQLSSSGGVMTTTNHSGQQWDAPNGWAPLQWMTVMAMEKYDIRDLSWIIARRWVSLNRKVYQDTGKFVEKYNVEDISLKAGGGEYPVQDGFGWTNGVYLALEFYLDNY